MNISHGFIWKSFITQSWEISHWLLFSTGSRLHGAFSGLFLLLLSLYHTGTTHMDTCKTYRLFQLTIAQTVPNNIIEMQSRWVVPGKSSWRMGVEDPKLENYPRDIHESWCYRVSLIFPNWGKSMKVTESLKNEKTSWGERTPWNLSVRIHREWKVSLFISLYFKMHFFHEDVCTAFSRSPRTVSK